MSSNKVNQERESLTIRAIFLMAIDKNMQCLNYEYATHKLAKEQGISVEKAQTVVSRALKVVYSCHKHAENYK